MFIVIKVEIAPHTHRRQLKIWMKEFLLFIVHIATMVVKAIMICSCPERTKFE